MGRFKFDQEKGVASLVYIAKRLGKDKADLHSVLKALYFAEQKHLVRYGRPVTGDIYSALKKGPIPSRLYDICKELRESGAPFGNLFRINKNSFISPLSDPDMDEFSDSDLECLDEAINEIMDLTFDERTKKSHDPAYLKAWNKRGHKQSEKINVIDIAIAGGADEEMQSYLKDELEFINAFC